MQITINGEQRGVSSAATLLELLQQLEIDPRAVVVEHNREIVRHPRLQEVTLSEGDAVELVHFVGGG